MLGGEHCAVYESADDGVLEFTDEGEGLRVAERKELVEFGSAGLIGLPRVGFRGIFGVCAEMVEDGGFEAAEAEVERVAAGFGEAEFYGGGLGGVFARRRLGGRGWGRPGSRGRGVWRLCRRLRRRRRRGFGRFFCR